MQIFLRIFLFSLSFNLHAQCNFKNNVNKVISLSGSTTVILKELGLLSHTKLKGISVFNPIHENEFKGTIYPGGIFFSHKSLSQLDQSVVFYDESRDLRRVLNSRKKVTLREVRTRNLVPLEAIDSTLHVLNEFIVGCEEKVTLLKDRARSLQEKILNLLPKGLTVIFYLGDTSNERLPEMIVANDGVVKWLRKEKRILTYPSELPYVNWSSKILRSFPTSTRHIGIVDSGKEQEKKIKKSFQRMTFTYPGALVPGLSQLEAFYFWAQAL